MPFKFENLKIWKLALDLADEISDMVKSFPKDELFILTSQIKRAADSVVLNTINCQQTTVDRRLSTVDCQALTLYQCHLSLKI